MIYIQNILIPYNDNYKFGLMTHRNTPIQETKSHIFSIFSYINDSYIYKLIHSGVYGWWDWFFYRSSTWNKNWYSKSIKLKKTTIPTITYEKCFRCHCTLPPGEQRQKLSINYCEPCYDIELQEILSTIMQEFRYKLRGT